MSNENNWQYQHLADVTQIMRDADGMFQKTGGSTRHYLRDVFFPMLQEKGFEIKKSDEQGEIERLKAENSKMRQALEGVRMSASRAGWNNHDPVKELEYIEKAATEALKKDSI